MITPTYYFCSLKAFHDSCNIITPLMIGKSQYYKHYNISKGKKLYILVPSIALSLWTRGLRFHCALGLQTTELLRPKALHDLLSRVSGGALTL